jgi:hypothetical protein
LSILKFKKIIRLKNPKTENGSSFPLGGLRGPPSPTLPPKGEGSLSILKFKKSISLKNPKTENASNFPLGGLRGLSFQIFSYI